ncbi:MAG: asparagine--tRNA ligase [Flavobacteriales bacterium]|nr:asparagine--tRNA ligase [Flavobacteriales bacterium]
MKRKKIKALIESGAVGSQVKVSGWVRSFRNDRFIAINDGSCIQTMQIVIESEKLTSDVLTQITVGSALTVVGTMVESQGRGQTIEIHAEEIKVVGHADTEAISKTILQPKRHSLETLREQAHLRFRTNTFGAVFRIRHHLAFAIHKYFNDRGFFYLHAPIITGSDAEGAGEMFKVTSLDLKSIPKNDTGEVDFSEDFFGKETHLTVSGQLEAELGALGLGQVYTFGPTFRAENSNTSRHLAEFWMIEPEIAFADLEDDMDLGEEFLKYCVDYILQNCKEDIEFLDNRSVQEDKGKPQAERNELTLTERMELIINNQFERITYTKAIEVLERSKPYKKKKFKFPVEWGTDLASEHERYLVEKHFKKPVIIYNYPASIKAFYMRNNDDNKTVAAMDVLFPGIGEIIGGSQREERLDVLKQKCMEFDIPEDHVWWYLETRKFGTVPHAGFGLGFERLVMFCTGMTNIRDVIPFPRTPKNAEF